MYFVSRKCKYLRSEYTDFRFKSSFGNVNKFYKKLSNTLMRFDREIFIKKSLEVVRRWKKHKLFKILLRVGADRIWLKLVWDTWDHPWTIPDLSFLWQFCSTQDGFKRTVSKNLLLWLGSTNTLNIELQASGFLLSLVVNVIQFGRIIHFHIHFSSSTFNLESHISENHNLCCYLYPKTLCINILFT